MHVKPLGQPFDLELLVPGSKSHANRALIAACLADGRTTIHNATACEDVDLMVANLGRMGFAVQWSNRESGEVLVDGGLPLHGGRATLNCGNAGTTLRFLTSLCCLTPGDWTVTGGPRMQQRPIAPLVESLRRLGADIEASDGYPPITIRGGSLRGGSVSLDAAVSSQFASSLLLVSPAVPEHIDVDIQNPISRPYLDLTREVMAEFGVNAASCTYSSPGRYTIEGDWSAAGALLVLAELTKSRLHIPNLNSASTQADCKMTEWIARLRGSGDRIIDCHDTPDQLMNLAVLAARRDGETRFVGAGNLRHKECDRLRVVTEELGKAGVCISEHDNGVLVRGIATLRPARLDPHGDHRMAMAFAILGSMHPGFEIEHPECVAKSYPAFFDDLAKTHSAPTCIALIGMRGAGKSTLGRQLGDALGLPFVDTDAQFEEDHGPIAAFVSEYDWATFRDIEERLAVAAIQPGRIVALGDGALLSAATRAHLRDRTIAVYLEGDTKTLQRRIAASDRPPLTGSSAVEELASTLAERRHMYEEGANITLPAGHSTSQLVEILKRGLRAQCSW